MILDKSPFTIEKVRIAAKEVIVGAFYLFALTGVTTSLAYPQQTSPDYVSQCFLEARST